MTEEQRRKAEFFAKLVSIPKLLELPTDDRRLLEEEAEKLFPWPKPDIEFLYGKAREWIGELLDGEKVQLQMPVLWFLEGGEFREEMYFKTQVPGRTLTDLIQLFREKPFPFHQCQTCKRVFVPTKKAPRQKYCSQQCAFHVYARTEGRKKYMQGYMAERRAIEKGLAKAKKKALARNRAGKLSAGQEEFAKHLKALPLSPWKTDQERKAYQAAEQQRLREILEKRRQNTTSQGRKEK